MSVPKGSPQASAKKSSTPLPYPVDERLREEEPSLEFIRPPGIQTLEAWGRLTVKDGKHKGKANEVIYAADVNYKNYMKCATTLTSAWALSFQHYCRARDVEAAQKEKELPTES